MNAPMVHAMNTPMVPQNANMQEPAMYQYTVLHPAPEFTVAQWKAASAHHEYEAKRLTVEAQQHITAAQRTQQHNEHLEAKAARCTMVINEKTTMITKLQMQLKMQQELVAATEKSRIELQEKASAAAEASTVLRMRLEKTEASCIRLMNEAADREKMLTALTHVEKPPRRSSQRTTAASPKKKLKPKKKKTANPAAATLTSATPTYKTDDEIMLKARNAFNGSMQCGDGPAEHQEMEREIAALYKILIAKRDAKKDTSDDKADHSFHPSNIFNGARAGFCFTTGPKGLGYYSDMKQQEIEVTTVAETDSEEDSIPSTPSSVMSEYADDHSQREPGESVAAMRMRLDNEHWDKHSRPHPLSAFQVGSAPAASASSYSSSSSSSQTRTRSTTASKARTLRKSKRTQSKAAAAKSRVAKREENSASDTDEVEDTDMEC